MILEDINDAAAEFQAAKAKYRDAFQQFKADLRPLPPDRFWPILDEFRKVAFSLVGRHYRPLGEAAADEFLRLAALGEIPVPFAAAVHFALSYRHYSGLCHVGGDKCRFSFDRGDDAYGDLMDAVVLTGREIVDRIIDADFPDLGTLTACVRHVSRQGAADASHGRNIADAILHGENYFAMHLEDESQRRVAIIAARKAVAK